jgi:hypothetical protein
LFSFAFTPGLATFTFVTEYAYRSPHAQRSFVYFSLSDVRDFRRELGDLAELQKFINTYSLAEHPRSIVVEHVASVVRNGTHILELWFGANFGGVNLSYAAATAFVRHARAEERNGTWLYRDASTGTVFDFERPFG